MVIPSRIIFLVIRMVLETKHIFNYLPTLSILLYPQEGHITKELLRTYIYYRTQLLSGIIGPLYILDLKSSFVIRWLARMCGLSPLLYDDEPEICGQQKLGAWGSENNSGPQYWNSLARIQSSKISARSRIRKIELDWGCDYSIDR